MESQRATLALLASTVLSGCALFLPPENEWKPGEPAPPLPVMAWNVEGDVRDVRTLRPISGAEVVLTTSRKGYVRRTRTDGAGRFEMGYSARANDDSNGEAAIGYLLTGHDSSRDTVTQVAIRVTCRGWKPVLVDNLHGKPLRLSMLPAEGVDAPSFDCGE